MTLAFCPMPSSRIVFSFSSPSCSPSKPLTWRSLVKGKVRILIEALRLRTARSIEAHDDLTVFIVERRQREALFHLNLVFERSRQRLDQRRRAALDAKHFVALAEHLKRLAQIGGYEVHQIETGLILREQPVLDVVGNVEHI